MKTLLRLLSFMATAWTLLTYIQPKRHPTWLYLGWIKIVAGSMTPVLALFGAIYTLLGWRRRDWLVVLTSLVGTVLALRHVAQVTAPHEAFDRAFGPYWRGDIPMKLRKRLRPRRFTPAPFAPRDYFFQRGLTLGYNSESGDAILADLWTPPPDVDPTGLGIIYLHGSAWHYMDKDMGTRPFFAYLTGQGHTVLDVAYTMAHKSRLPGMVGDVKQAIAWFKLNAAALKVNPERIILWGGSAGGHLALLSAYTPNHPKWQPANLDVDTGVRGVVSYYGLTDLAATQHLLAEMPDLPTYQQQAVVNMMRKVRLLPLDGEFVSTAELVPHLLGGALADMPELYDDSSPIRYVGPHCPPTLLINGAHDFAVEVSQHQRLHGALVAADVAAAHIEFPLTDHAFDLFFPAINPAGQSALYDLERFLALLMK
ncbi:MAG: alpha/beta hydrolase [Chloroflexi bacterium]|nr:alpha/beta hydrolase [Chloroflexota bacterium]